MNRNEVTGKVSSCRLPRNVASKALLGLFWASLTIGMIGSFWLGEASAQNDPSFREFDATPSPVELLRLLGHDAQVGENGQNPLPFDEEFQEWLQEEMMPQLSSDDREELRELSEDIQRQADELGANATNQQLAEAAREELARRPELRERIEQELANDETRQRLEEMLQGLGPGQGNSNNGTPPNRSPSGDPSGQSNQQNPGGGTDPNPRVGPDGQELPSGVNGNGPNGTGTQGPNSPNNGQPGGGPPNNQNPTQPQGGQGSGPSGQNQNGSSTGQPGQSSTGNGDPSDPNPSVGDPGNGTPPNGNGANQQSAGANQRNNGNGPGQSENPRQPNSSGNSRNNQNQRSEQQQSNDEPDSQIRRQVNENESFRQRFNRMMFDAASDTLSKPEEDGSENAISAAISRIATQVHEGTRNTDARKRIQSSLREAQSRSSRGRERARNSIGPMPENAIPSTDSIQTILIVFAILCGLGVAGYLIFRWNPQLVQSVSRYAQVISQTRAFQANAISSDRELVASVDRFVFWRFGYGAHWWHGGHVKRQLLEQHPEIQPQVERLLHSYEQARYSLPTKSLSKSDYDACATILRQLVGLNPVDSPSTHPATT